MKRALRRDLVVHGGDVPSPRTKTLQDVILDIPGMLEAPFSKRSIFKSLLCHMQNKYVRLSAVQDKTVRPCALHVFVSRSSVSSHAQLLTDPDLV